MGKYTDNLCAGMMFIYSFFGIALAISPRLFFGPDSKFCYWTAMDEAGCWFGRAGGVLLAFSTTAPYWAGIQKKAMAKMFLPCNALFLLQFINAAFFMKSTGPCAHNILPMNMWLIQIPVGVVLLALNTYALKEK
mmetsp:Transcript_31088/g.54598  ORF Transcript_31088/g.54598 Transcript_31088/m.54598 type:complete len:135 (-) Transcript_31088:93-497(-)|eukprot:CAMPEP_0197531002 /NCGR_PEP_ID=MMETSP1318-20131121/33772_1 /TAXON_ID=552666 /ORGANISM="Partenskyella glossopodia, Strain RCC365" /LENGTH=134 /DNA_ID=CAMNT_0043087055 /DNA_START=45 /DNA_END=449 /DNA_ORIENTATION=+